MADIDIQRKSGMGWLWWVLGLIVLALLAWWFLAADNEEVATDPTLTEQPAVEVAPAPMAGASQTGTATTPAVNEYMTACAERAPGDMGLEHQYTSDCITRLVTAVEATLQGPSFSGVDAQAELQAARQAADRLTQTTQSTEHAGMTREAFASTAALLNRLQDERFPNLDDQATRLEQTAQSIQTSAPLLEQRTAVQDYFRQAGDLLNGLSSAQ